MQVKKAFKNLTQFHFLLALFALLIILQIHSPQINYLPAFIPELNSHILESSEIHVAKAYRILLILIIVLFMTILAFMVRKISKFKKKLLNLQRQQAVLNLHAIVSVADKSGEISYVNKKFNDISGYKFSELLGQNHRLLNSGFHPKEFFIDMWETISSGNVWHGDICNRAKDGHLYWVQSTIAPFFNEHNEVESYISIRTEITRQKEMEQAAIKSEEWQRTILNNLGDGVYLLDLQGRLTYLNAAGERLFDFSFDELKHKFVHDILHHHSSDGLFLPYQECPIAISMRAEAIYQSDDELFFRKNGEKFPASVCSAPLYEANKLVGTVVCFRDITEQHAIQKQLIEAKNAAEKATRVKSEFLSTMSHEIRTPMNGVIGMTDLLLDTELNADQLEFATIIKSSSNALLEIINHILDFSKIESGQFELEQLNFSFKEVVNDSTDVISARAYEKSLSLISFIDPKIPEYLLGDPMRLRQVCLNFLNNAIKFTSKGTVFVRAILLEKNATLVWVRVEISDSGIGISPETQQRLFQPFSQADSSTTRKYGGTGLGLSICKKLIELINGRVGVESELGKGSLFWFELPLLLANNVDQHTIDTAQFTGKLMLVLGFAQGHHEIYISYLQSWGISVHSCKNVADMPFLLEQVEDSEKSYDAILLGAGLETKELLQTILLIRMQTALKNVPIIACQSRRKVGVRNDLLDSGATHVLTNPVKQSILFDSLMEIFYQKIDATAERKKSSKMIHKILSVSGENYHLLLVEDNEVNQKIALRLLEKMGFSVDVINNGQDAVDILKKASNYDLVLMDCQMPIMDGFVATRLIRHHELREKIFHIPIVAMTANAMHGDKERCINSGMDDYVSKPIKIETLQKVLKKWLPNVANNSEENNNEITQNPPQIALTSNNIEPAINIERMLDLFENDEEIIYELFGVFYRSIESFQTKLAEEVNAQSKNVAYIVHNIKGSGANIGAEDLRDLCEQLESVDLTKNWLQVQHLTTQIENELNRVKVFIENWRSSKI